VRPSLKESLSHGEDLHGEELLEVLCSRQQRVHHHMWNMAREGQLEGGANGLDGIDDARIANTDTDTTMWRFDKRVVTLPKQSSSVSEAFKKRLEKAMAKASTGEQTRDLSSALVALLETTRDAMRASGWIVCWALEEQHLS